MQERNGKRLRERYGRSSFKRYGRKLIERRGENLILPVTDKHGNHTRRLAYRYDDDRLWAWCEDADQRERTRRRAEARRLKRYITKSKQRIRRRGFKFRITCYGIYRNPDTGLREYRRYEIFKAEKWTRVEVARLHVFLKTHVPKSRAGVFAFHKNALYVHENDQLAKFTEPLSILMPASTIA